jgi:hypothetical protein
VYSTRLGGGYDINFRIFGRRQDHQNYWFLCDSWEVWLKADQCDVGMLRGWNPKLPPVFLFSFSRHLRVECFFAIVKPLEEEGGVQVPTQATELLQVPQTVHTLVTLDLEVGGARVRAGNIH